jgi:hypothetical protein
LCFTSNPYQTKQVSFYIALWSDGGSIRSRDGDNDNDCKEEETLSTTEAHSKVAKVAWESEQQRQHQQREESTRCTTQEIDNAQHDGHL